MTATIVLVLLAILVVVLVAALAFVAWKLGLLEPKPTGNEPYRCCDRVLSPAEQKFQAALLAALPVLCQRAGRSDAPLVFAKVRLGDVLTTDRDKATERAGKDGWQAARNRIDRKHVDFLLCAPSDTRPVLVIELDDKTHQRADRKERDEFLDRACKAAGLPVLHVPCIPPSVSYDPGKLAADIAAALKV